MEIHFLGDIPFNPDISRIFKLLKVETDEEEGKILEKMIREAKAIARPKALFACAFIDEKGSDYVIIEGLRFKSRILSINLEGVHRCFPYIATCGIEIEEWSKSVGGILESFWADTIKQQALACASDYLKKEMEKAYGLGKTSMMNPGSLEDWPIEEQRMLFRLLGIKVNDTGVALSESCLMYPIKSVSGIRFETESGFENCMLCSRKNCPGRHAEYDPELYKRKYS